MFHSKKTHVILSVVALLLVALTVVGVTYSWIDDVKQVEFNNNNLAKNNAPLKTGVDINSSIVINHTENTIDLGNILKDYNMSDYIDKSQPGYDPEKDDDVNYWAQHDDSDLSYQYSDNGNAVRHIKYDGAPESAKQPNWNDSADEKGIDSKKGYFYESGDMHLSGCYSDGEHFLFPIWKADGTTVGYRDGNKDDENVNYISFTAQVSSPDANVDFWFDTVPTIKAHGTTTEISNARYAIIVDGNSHVYSSNGVAYSQQNTFVPGVRRTDRYTYGNTANITAERGENSNTLFSIKKGNTVNLTIKIWLEEGFNSGSAANISAADIDFRLVSSWAKTRTITIVDKTTANLSKSWLKDDNATLYLTCPSLLNEYSKTIYNTENPSVANWKLIPSYTDGNGYSYNFAPFKVLQNPTVIDGDDVYTTQLPLVYHNEEMILYRCAARTNASDPLSGWNVGKSRNINGDYGVKYWNWWHTYTPDTFVDATYTLYGGSHDDYAAAVVTDDKYKNTFLGYGTWGDVEQITVKTEYGSSKFAQCTILTDANNKQYSYDNLYIRDYSDYETSQETYVHTMYWDNSAKQWKAYIPKSNALIQFINSEGNVGGNPTIHGMWGYNTWADGNGNFRCPQQRPIKSNIYSANSVVYQLADNDSDSNNKTLGRGYWEGADLVYLIKNGDIASHTAYAHMYDNNHKDSNNNALTNGNYQMIAVPNVNAAGQNITYNGAAVLKSDTVKHIAGVYKDVIFNNNEGSKPWSVNSGEQIVYPGCFYDFNANKWYGSLDDDGRNGEEETTAAEPPTSPPGFDLEDTVPNTDGMYAYGNLRGDGNNVYVKFTEAAVGGYVLMSLTQGTTYNIQLKKRTGTWRTFGSGPNNTVVITNTQTSSDYNLNANDTGSLVIKASVTGVYKVQIYEHTDVENNRYVNIRFVANP